MITDCKVDYVLHQLGQQQKKSPLNASDLNYTGHICAELRSLGHSSEDITALKDEYVPADAVLVLTKELGHLDALLALLVLEWAVLYTEIQKKRLLPTPKALTYYITTLSAHTSPKAFLDYYNELSTCDPFGSSHYKLTAAAIDTIAERGDPERVPLDGYFEALTTWLSDLATGSSLPMCFFQPYYRRQALRRITFLASLDNVSTKGDAVRQHVQPTKKLQHAILTKPVYAQIYRSLQKASNNYRLPQLFPDTKMGSYRHRDWPIARKTEYERQRRHDLDQRSFWFTFFKELSEDPLAQRDLILALLPDFEGTYRELREIVITLRSTETA